LAARGKRTRPKGTTHRHTHSPGRDGKQSPYRSVVAGAATTGLDRGPQRPHRHARGRRECRRSTQYATELVALTPDVLVAFGSAPTDHLLRSTRTVPIVFTIVTDPLGSGFVNNLARPSGNATGFMLFEYSLSGKWLDLLMQIAPDIKRVAVMPAPAQPSGARRYGTKVRQRGHFV
jgi:hypothetical protein